MKDFTSFSSVAGRSGDERPNGVIYFYSQNQILNVEINETIA